MDQYKVNGESLKMVADSIRAKAGTTEELEFPYGFKVAIDRITGGGEIPKEYGFITYDQNKTITIS